MTTKPTHLNGKRLWSSPEPARRPYRIWDANAKKDVRYRYYAIERNALDGALLEARWGKVGTALEVYDCRHGTLLGTFKRHATTLSFTKP
jgi:predicted DNA-binding WGR domain protein